ncbi:uncharacterized protein PSANT_01001 [Moesziomyces antarcticus]|uniref:Uncharacterized protein n=1 Tax=Pseudozyma antarctica TaxID=84753 RepID=A0A5C3FHY1_PSEA2|nr:uncharacterized protein PSANT_01001 [Moesziomyces antarcticus]
MTRAAINDQNGFSTFFESWVGHSLALHFHLTRTPPSAGGCHPPPPLRDAAAAQLASSAPNSEVVIPILVVPSTILYCVDKADERQHTALQRLSSSVSAF